MNRVGIVLFAALLALMFFTAPPAHAAPMMWCNPSSPLYDQYMCWQAGNMSNYACDPNVDSYNANYCAATQGPDYSGD